MPAVARRRLLAGLLGTGAATVAASQLGGCSVLVRSGMPPPARGFVHLGLLRVIESA